MMTFGDNQTDYMVVAGWTALTPLFIQTTRRTRRTRRQINTHEALRDINRRRVRQVRRVGRVYPGLSRYPGCALPFQCVGQVCI